MSTQSDEHVIGPDGPGRPAIHSLIPDSGITRNSLIDVLTRMLQEELDAHASDSAGNKLAGELDVPVGRGI